MAAVTSILIASAAEAQATYFIDESTDFTGNGCPNADLNDVTGHLQNRLNASGWTGERWMNADAWVSDFQDEAIVSGGSEGWATDTKMLAVYAGHGNANLLQFGFPNNGSCLVVPSSHTRLGTITGNVAAYGMFLTSCTMRVNQLSSLWANEVRQQFGYNNSPSIYGGSAGDFFDDTATMTNTNAWLERMDDRWGLGWNSPVVLTFGQSAADCSNTENTARLRSGILRDQPPEPWGWWCLQWRDNGCGGCGAGC